MAIIPGAASIVSWAEDKPLLTIGHEDGSVTLWDFSQNPAEERLIAPRYSSWVMRTSLSPSQSRLATGYADGTLMVWNLSDHTLEYTSTLSKHTIDRLAWNSDNRFLAAASIDVVSVVDLETDAEVQRFDQGVISLHWEPNSYLLIGKLWAGTGGVTVWDTQTGTVVTELRYTGMPGLSSPDGKRVLGSGIWDIEIGQQITQCSGCFVASWSYAWSSDSEQVAIGSGPFMCFEGSQYCERDYNIRAWNVETDVEPTVLSGHTDAVVSLVWHPQGRQITSVSMDNTARIWDVPSQSLLQSFYVGDLSHIRDVALYSGGNMVAVNYVTEIHVLLLSSADLASSTEG